MQSIKEKKEFTQSKKQNYTPPQGKVQNFASWRKNHCKGFAWSSTTADGIGSGSSGGR